MKPSTVSAGSVTNEQFQGSSSSSSKLIRFRFRQRKDAVVDSNAAKRKSAPTKRHDVSEACVNGARIGNSTVSEIVKDQIQPVSSCQLKLSTKPTYAAFANENI